MTINIVCNAQPTVEPITLEEAKLHLRIDMADTSPPTTHPDDALVTALIKASRRWCEQFCNRAFVTQTWTLYLDEFPEEDYIEFPLPPLQAIVALSYKDAAGTLQTVSFLDPSGTYLFETDDYIVHTARERGRLYLKYGLAWPETLSEVQAVQVQFVAGYGLAADVPEEIKAAIKIMLSGFYENRGDQDPGPRHQLAVKALLWPERVVPV